ncbi:MAG TPA: diguanylate cyclase [Anaerolineaceae bacterium]|nr:diguanylate cyclase [Anaerolineaceae bacterium]
MNPKGTILVVDDTLVSLRLTSLILTSEGYEVHSATSGELALASIAAEPPELILMDICMPEMDGFEVLRQVKAQESCCNIPIIFISATIEKDQRVEGLKLGAVDFISKPFEIENLLARVKIHIELGQLRNQLEKQAHNLLHTNEQLQILARTDSLTGLYNRRHFFELAKTEFKRSKRYQRPLTALMMDVDFFKEVNDSYGHQTGDTVLAEIARLCKTNTRETDIIGRYGGDEFIFILSETELANGIFLAQRIQGLITATVFSSEGGNFHLTVSFGAAGFEPGCASLEELIKQSDAALYKTKQAGGNGVNLSG